MHKLRYVCTFILLAVCVACSDKKNDTVITTPAQPTVPEQKQSVAAELVVPDSTKSPTPSASPQTTIEPGSIEMNLANKSGCLACHKVEKKLVGPAWRDVAKRYAGDKQAKQKLIEKVSSGGKGNWTDVTGGVAMPPYSPRVSNENIQKLVDFVLSLNEQE